MDSENPNIKSSDLNKDEKEGFNENSNYEDAKNDYENDLPDLNENEKENTVNTTEPGDNKNSNESRYQKNPGSSGAFPVGAFDSN